MSFQTSSLISTQLKSITLIDMLQEKVFNQADQRAFTFLLDGEGEEDYLTYRQIDQRARSIAAQLQQAEIFGERVLLLYPPGLEFIAAFFGCLYAGAIAVPAYPPRKNHSIKRLQSIIADAQATVALTTAAQLAHIQAQLAATDSSHLRWIATDHVAPDLAADWQMPKIQGDTLAFLQYTSGSTGTPKGVMVSHSNLLHNEHLIQQASQHSETAIVAGWLPVYHDMGLIGNLLQPLYLGRPCILMSPVAFLQKPVRWLQMISHYRATSSGGPNFAYDLCVNRISPEQRNELDLSCWDWAFTGAEPIRAETLERFATTFASCGFRREAFYPCYGMAEGTLFITGGWKAASPVVKHVDAIALEQNRMIAATSGQLNVRSLVGCGHSWCEQIVRIVDPETRNECPDGQVGEIWAAGNSIAQGYWNQPELTQAVFQAYTANTNEGPFLRTGDLGFLQDGELFFAGRLKDIVIIRGRNHYPQDIELTVEESHPLIRRSGCVAAFSADIANEERLIVVAEVEQRYRGQRRSEASMPDEGDRRRESPPAGADAKTRQPLDVQAVIGNIRQAISAEHGLQVYGVFLIKAGSIPRTSSGKIQRYACRSSFLTETLEVVGSNFLG